MRKNKSRSYKVFTIFNIGLLSFLAILCILPFINLLAVSFSSSSYAPAVTFWPKGMTSASYQYIFKSMQIIRSLGVSILRITLAVPFTLLITTLCAYPLTRSKEQFHMKNVYLIIYLIPMFIGGGIIPFYILMSNLNLIGSIWSLVLPGGVQIFNIVLLLNYFRAIPKEYEESARVDGGGHFRVLFSIFVPLSKPIMATLVLFAFVGNWNAWFDGLIFMQDPKQYPLQTYMYTIMQGFDNMAITADKIDLLQYVDDRTNKAALIIIGMIPILMIYPVLQKYFKSGIMLGGVKG